MRTDFLISEVYQDLADEKSPSQKESESRAEATMLRFKELRLKGWRAGYHLTGRPVLDAETLGHFFIPDAPVKEGLPRLKMRDLQKLELKDNK